MYNIRYNDIVTACPVFGATPGDTFKCRLNDIDKDQSKDECFFEFVKIVKGWFYFVHLNGIAEDYIDGCFLGRYPVEIENGEKRIKLPSSKIWGFDDINYSKDYFPNDPENGSPAKASGRIPDGETDPEGM